MRLLNSRPFFPGVVSLLLIWGGMYAQSPPKAAPPSNPRVPDSAGISDGVYHHPSFGFSCKIPYGWVDRTADMGDDATDAAKGQVLLAVFEHPPEATGEAVNASIVIAVESVSSYPGLKTAADYFAPLTEVVTAKGFKVVNEPYEFAIGAKALVGGDFRKELGKLTMFQSTLATLQKGYILSFTFVAGSEEDTQDLIEGLSFAGAHKPSTATAPAPKN